MLNVYFKIIISLFLFNTQMNKTFSSAEFQKTVNLNADLIMRQYKLDKMTKFMAVKSINPKLEQSEIARQLKISSSTLQRYREEINIPSPYTILNTHTRKQNSSDHDPKMTWNDLKVTSKDDDKAVSKKTKSGKKLKGGNPDDVNLSNERAFIEQGFSST